MNACPEISIVIVNYNTYVYTAQCINSIFDNPPARPYEIIVVDNASSDKSVSLISTNFPEIRLVTSDKNKGIAGGNNLGIKESKGIYVLLLNNDTIVLPDTIEQCASFLDNHPEAGGVGGNLINPDGSFQSGAWYFPSLWEEFLHVSRLGLIVKQYFPNHSNKSKGREVDWMSTAFMLFPRAALEKVGLVDELFFIYSDEVDLEYRLWRSGYKIWYLPWVKTIHFGGKSLQPWKSRALVFRGRLLFFRKHHTLIEEIVVRVMYFLASTLKVLFWLIAFLLHYKRSFARNELASHLKIIQYSLTFNFSPID